MRPKPTRLLDHREYPVLCVDDEPDNLRVFELSFRRDFKILTAQSAKEGLEKKLEIVGVGYLAAVQGDELQMRVGYANEIKKEIPQGLTVTCPDQNHVVVQGCDKQLVGQFAAEVRAVRKPEPYKGKGVRYVGEVVKIKPGKSAT